MSDSNGRLLVSARNKRMHGLNETKFFDRTKHRIASRKFVFYRLLAALQLFAEQGQNINPFYI